MGMLISAILALSAYETVPAQTTHYGHLAEGFVRSRFIRKGMTYEEVRKILGQEPSGGMFGVINTTFYIPLGIGIMWSWHDDIQESRVGNVGWGCRRFKK
jgi:hypothetical protein